MIALVDAATLAPQRSFGKFSGGARHLAIAPNSKWLAVHGLIGIDFFDLGTGERMYRILTSRDATQGRFLGGSAGSDYIAYGTHGFVRRYAPELGVEMAAYRSRNEGTIEQIREPPGPQRVPGHFRPAVSDRMVVRCADHFSQACRSIGRGGVDMRMPAQIEAFGFSGDGKEVLASLSIAAPGAGRSRPATCGSCVVRASAAAVSSTPP